MLRFRAASTVSFAAAFSALSLLAVPSYAQSSSQSAAPATPSPLMFRFRRTTAAAIPPLMPGQPVWVTDSRCLGIGTDGTLAGNVFLALNTAATTDAFGLVKFAASGAASSGFAVEATDSRLSNARVPVAHTHDASDIATGTISAARLPAGSTTAAGILQLAAAGSATSGRAVDAADPRLSDARTPLAHNQDASTITSGTLAAARLPASGVTAASKRRNGCQLRRSDLDSGFRGRCVRTDYRGFVG